MAILLCGELYSQTTPAFDAKTWIPPYALMIPDKWNVERFPIPIEFAPQIPYKGVEDIRFTPGWGDAKSKEYWSYCFLWFLEGKPQINSDIIEKNLAAYYTGLIGRNIEPRKIPKEKIFPPKTSFKKIKTSNRDTETFQGTIYMLDYMQQQPITLHCVVHLNKCTTWPGKTFVFYEISPQPPGEEVWVDMNNIYLSFDCSKPSAK